MQKILSVLITTAVVALSGCASTITAIQDSPSKPHTLKGGRFFTVTGERRLAFQVYRQVDAPDGSGRGNVDGNGLQVAWCAESLPEVATAVSASSKPNAALAGKLTLGTEDTFSTSLTQTFTRTEIAEVYRQMAWQACQAWAQGVYSNQQYRGALDTILKAGVYIVEKRADQALSSPVNTATNPVTPPSPTPPVATIPAPAPASGPTITVTPSVNGLTLQVVGTATGAAKPEARTATTTPTSPH